MTLLKMQYSEKAQSGDGRLHVYLSAPATGTGNNPEDHPPVAVLAFPRRRTITSAVSSSPFRRSLLAA
jgi:hypothetical protein